MPDTLATESPQARSSDTVRSLDDGIESGFRGQYELHLDAGTYQSVGIGRDHLSKELRPSVWKRQPIYVRLKRGLTLDIAIVICPTAAIAESQFWNPRLVRCTIKCDNTPTRPTAKMTPTAKIHLDSEGVGERCREP
jgi:hypothetical protein